MALMVVGVMDGGPGLYVGPVPGVSRFSVTSNPSLSISGDAVLSRRLV